MLFKCRKQPRKSTKNLSHRRNRRIGLTGMRPAFGQMFSYPAVEGFEIEINNRREEKRQQLRNEQASDDGKAQRLARFATCAETEGDLQTSHQRGHRCHHDRAKAKETTLVNGVVRRLAAALRVESEVNHH